MTDAADPAGSADADAGAADRVPVYVVVVAYGDPGTLAGCLAALGPVDGLVVVDNSSSAATRALALRAGATYLDPGNNLGFAAAVNRGLAEVPLPDADVLLLNPDAEIGPAALDVLRQALHADADVACVAPDQHRPGSERPSPVCWPFPTPAGAWHEAVGFGRYARGWGYVIASVLLVRGAALVDVGGLDEGFFLYAEEADWERRATRRGWTVRFCPEASASHVGAATDPDPARREVRFHAGVETYVRKWHGARGWHMYQLATILTALRRAVLSPRSRRRSSLRLARLYAAGPLRSARHQGLIPVRPHHVPALGPAPEAG